MGSRFGKENLSIKAIFSKVPKTGLGFTKRKVNFNIEEVLNSINFKG